MAAIPQPQIDFDNMLGRLGLTPAGHQHYRRNQGVTDATTFLRISVRPKAAESLHKAMNQAIFKALADSLATGTLGYLIQRFRRTMDGRAAFEALRDACYSSTQAILCVQTTHDLLSAARWTAGSNLETFIAKHLRGHDILRRHGSDASEQQKLLWFLRGLNDNGDYRSVSLAMGAIATFVQAIMAIIGP
jgi:hypothetical protein